MMINLIEFCYSNVSINIGIAYDALTRALLEIGNLDYLNTWEIHDPKCPYQRQDLPNPAIYINGQLLQEAYAKANPHLGPKAPQNGEYYLKKELVEMLSMIDLHNKYPKANTIES